MRTGILGLMLAGVVALSSGCGLVRARQTVADIAAARCEGEPGEADWSRAAGVTFGKTGAARQAHRAPSVATRGGTARGSFAASRRRSLSRTT